MAFTYYGHREKLRMIGREDDLEPLNRQALRLAKEVAAEGDALVAGNICNTWVFDPEAPESSGEAVREMYREQVAWADEEGADLVIAETNDYVGEALIAARGDPGVRTAVGRDVRLDRTTDDRRRTSSTRRAGGSRQPVRRRRRSQLLARAGDDAAACSSGSVRRSTAHVAAQPVPYRTTSAQPTFQSLRDADGTRVFPLALDPFVCTRFELADFAAAARDAASRYIGVCCGGAPHHVRAMAEASGRTVPASRYSPDLTLHPILGDNVQESGQKYANWKD